MKINETSNNSFQNKVLIDTFIEQISALQTDVSNLQVADDNLSLALSTKADTASIQNEVSTNVLDAQSASIKTLEIQGDNSGATISSATIGNATINQETVDQSNITNLHATDVHAGTVNTGTLTVDNDTLIGGNLAVQDVSAKDITSASVNTLNLTAAEADVNKLEAQTAEISNKLTVNDLEVSGTFTGVSHIETDEVEADSVKADEVETETLNVEKIRDWVSQVMNQEYALTPTPQLQLADRYTIELPSFDGVFLLSWEDANDIVWSATVIGNGQTYGVSWGSRTDINYVTDIFEFNGKVYIRVNSNGRLKYAYSATKELPEIKIYYNMDGWTYDKSLEELCNENNHIINTYPSGMVWFGPVYIPRLKTLPSENFNLVLRGSCKLNELPSLADSEIGDVWNITSYGYTNENFLEGAGLPVNIGDDVIAVNTKITEGKFVPYDDLPELEEGSSFRLIHNFGNALIAVEYNSSHNYDGYTTRASRIWKKKEDGWTPVTDYTTEDWTGRPLENLGRIFLFQGESSYGYGGNALSIYSDDNGDTWTTAGGSVPTYPNCQGAVALPDGTILVSCRNDMFTISTDNGETYEYTPEEGIRPLVALSDGSALCLFSDPYNYDAPKYLKKTFNGIDFTTVAENIDIDIGINSVIRTSNGALLSGGYRCYKSNDEGATWIVVSPESRYNFGTYIVGIGNKLYSSGGFISENNGSSWQHTIDFEIHNYQYPPCPIDENRVIYLESVYDSAVQHDITEPKLWISAETKILVWDKFAAGVNYENFVAERITATTALKSEGTLEVDGKATFNDDAEFTKENAEITENGINIINTGNKVETVAGTSTETVTGAKTVNLTAGETINGNVELNGKAEINGEVELNGDVTQTGDLDIRGEIIARDDVSISGDLYVNGTEHINDTETSQTSDNYLVLRHNRTTALGTNEHSGIVVHNYSPNKSATLTADYEGTWRIADNTETSTEYTYISYYNGVYYNGISHTTVIVNNGIKSAWDEDELDECVYTSYNYYHYDGTDWFTVSLVNNSLTIGSKVTDAALITTLNSLTKADLVYFRSLTVTTISEIENEPILTRAEATDLPNKGVLVWDAAAEKAIATPAPTLSNQVLTAQISGGTTTYQWKSGGSGSVSRFATLAAAQAALAIPEGSDGYIPDNGIVIVDELNQYITGEDR